MLAKVRPNADEQSATDLAMMRRCITLSAEAAKQGEFPFAALIADGNRVVVKVTNRVVRKSDVTQHAELLAVSEAQRVLGRNDLSSCTIYSNIEPCAMCSFSIRETGIGRVVFAISSPMMGGFSKWGVLRDTEISNVMPEAFGGVPEVVVGLLRQEAEQVWREWNSVAWAIIRQRGCFGPERAGVHYLESIPRPRSILRAFAGLYRMWRGFGRGSRSTPA
ncbi:MAG TPA: nucleoside deaminase [Pseudolabrys sp.]|nr:nucleoside deaminase [Pseudolabrys sp.]